MSSRRRKAPPPRRPPCDTEWVEARSEGLHSRLAALVSSCEAIDTTLRAYLEMPLLHSLPQQLGYPTHFAATQAATTRLSTSVTSLANAINYHFEKEGAGLRFISGDGATIVLQAASGPILVPCLADEGGHPCPWGVADWGIADHAAGHGSGGNAVDMRCRLRHKVLKVVKKEAEVVEGIRQGHVDVWKQLLKEVERAQNSFKGGPVRGWEHLVARLHEDKREYTFSPMYCRGADVGVEEGSDPFLRMSAVLQELSASLENISFALDLFYSPECRETVPPCICAGHDMGKTPFDATSLSVSRLSTSIGRVANTMNLLFTTCCVSVRFVDSSGVVAPGSVQDDGCPTAVSVECPGCGEKLSSTSEVEHHAQVSHAADLAQGLYEVTQQQYATKVFHVVGSEKQLLAASKFRLGALYGFLLGATGPLSFSTSSLSAFCDLHSVEPACFVHDPRNIATGLHVPANARLAEASPVRSPHVAAARYGGEWGAEDEDVTGPKGEEGDEDDPVSRLLGLHRKKRKVTADPRTMA